MKVTNLVKQSKNVLIATVVVIVLFSVAFGYIVWNKNKVESVRKECHVSSVKSSQRWLQDQYDDDSFYLEKLQKVRSEGLFNPEKADMYYEQCLRFNGLD